MTFVINSYSEKDVILSLLMRKVIRGFYVSKLLFLKTTKYTLIFSGDH